MLKYNLIVSALIALAAFSTMTIQAHANWEPTPRDATIGALRQASERAAPRDDNASWIQESIQLRRGLCELGNRPQRLSEQDLDLCVLRSL
jgi:hypothetical protein